MTPEKQAELDAVAAERASSLPQPVKQVTVADLHQRVAALEGKPLSPLAANDFHQRRLVLEEKYGVARAKFIETLTTAHILQDDNSTHTFLRALDIYDEAVFVGPDGLTGEQREAVGSGSERWPDQEEADAVAANAEKEMAERRYSGGSDAPLPETTNG